MTCGHWDCMPKVAMNNHTGVEWVPQTKFCPLPTKFCQYSSLIFSTDDSLVDWAKEDAL